MTNQTLHDLCSPCKARLHELRLRSAPAVTYAGDTMGKKKSTKSALDRYKRDVGRRLREARLAANIGSQAEAAERLSSALGTAVEPSRIGNYEQGTRLADPLTVQELAAIYGTNPSAIYGFDEAPAGRDEQALLAKYRQTDERGKRAIQSIAESQPTPEIMSEPRKQARGGT